MDKKKISLLLVLLVCSFALGRYTVPTSIKEETKTAKVEDKKDISKEKTVTDKKYKIIVKEEKRPDGTVVRTETKVYDNKKENTKTDKKEEKVAESSESKKETKREGSRLSFSLLAGTRFNFTSTTPIDYGIMVSRDVIGPFHLGVFAFTSKLVGLGVGVSF